MRHASSRRTLFARYIFIICNVLSYYKVPGENCSFLQVTIQLNTCFQQNPPASIADHFSSSLSSDLISESGAWLSDSAICRPITASVQRVLSSGPSHTSAAGDGGGHSEPPAGSPGRRAAQGDAAVH